MIRVRTHSELTAWLNQQLERDDLSAETRKKLSNRLKMRNPKHPRASRVARGFYTPSQWAAMRKRRKAAQASKRRNRRG